MDRISVFNQLRAEFLLFGVLFIILGEPILFDSYSLQYLHLRWVTTHVVLDSSVFVCFCSAAAAASSRRCAFLTLHSLHLRSEDIVRWRFYVFGIWQFRRREYERVWGNDLWNHRSAKHPFQELDPPPPPSPPVSIRFLFLAPLLKCPIVSC